MQATTRKVAGWTVFIGGLAAVGAAAPYLDAQLGAWWWIAPLIVLAVATAGR